MPEDTSWNLDAMMAARKRPNGGLSAHSTGTSAEKDRAVTSNHIPTQQEPDSTVLRHQVTALQIEVNKVHREADTLRKNLSMAQRELTSAREALASTKIIPESSVPSSDLKHLQATLSERNHQVDVLNKEVDHLSALQEQMHQEVEQKDAALKKNRNELESMRAALGWQAVVQQAKPVLADISLQRENSELKTALTLKSEALGTLQNISKKQIEELTHLQVENSHEHDVLTTRLKEKEAALAAERKHSEEQAIALQASLAGNKKATLDMNAALAARSNELKQAAATLAALREKQKQSEAVAAPVTNAQRQAYMAGVMMAEGLHKRLDGWQLAGVETDGVLFRAGLTDGLQGLLRLEPAAARQAQEAFIRAVQAGAARKVSDAQKQLNVLAKGRKALKSRDGISWYRVRKGKPVAPGKIVTLAMTEQIAGGAEISKVPSMTLQPSDDVPSIVKDGMYLPGEGGEVVAYALARSVYGDLPLPPGVQPFTVMEYHLTGSPVAARGTSK